MDETRTGTWSRRWLWIAALWLGIGLIDASQTVFPMRAQGMHHAWVRLFVTLLVSWLPWALATPPVIGLRRRFPLFPHPGPKAVAAHLGALAAIGLITAAWSTVLEILLNPWAQSQPPGPSTQLWLSKFSYGLLTSLIVYAVIVAVAAVMDSRERIARQQMETARLGEQLSRAQLNALRQQLEPHFMFNALNAISGLIRDNRNDEAVTMIVGLSEFLRRAAEDSLRPLVALAEEVEYLRRYLGIQKIRFAERLQVNVDVPAELLELPVPSLVLQPLVENAIKHGIARRAEGGVIRVAGSRANDRLSLTVSNSGPRLPAGWVAKQAGIGLSNLRARLEILYGTRFELNLRSQEAGGVEVMVSLPVSRE